MGLLTTLSEGVGIHARAAPPHAIPPIAASAVYLPPHDAHVGTPGLTMRAWYATLGACPIHSRDARARWNGCIAFAGGTATASGLELQTMRTTSPTLVGAEASMSFDLMVAGPLSLGAFADALVPFGRHRFFATVRDVDVELFKTWPVVPTVGLALRVEGGS
jgi:hypothetical protein